MIAHWASSKKARAIDGFTPRLAQQYQQYDDDRNRRSSQILLADVLSTPYRASTWGGVVQRQHPERRPTAAAS